MQKNDGYRDDRCKRDRDSPEYRKFAKLKDRRNFRHKDRLALLTSDHMDGLRPDTSDHGAVYAMGRLRQPHPFQH